jgi:hypothetical protein
MSTSSHDITIYENKLNIIIGVPYLHDVTFIIFVFFIVMIFYQHVNVHILMQLFIDTIVTQIYGVVS